jgi:hypothetical protein
LVQVINASQITVFLPAEPFRNVLIAEVPASKTPDTWTQLTTSCFFIPACTTAMTVTHILVGAVTLTADDHLLRRIIFWEFTVLNPGRVAYHLSRNRRTSRA